MVTGALTGMGAATAKQLARKGFQVLAGVRRAEDGDRIRAAGIEPVILDITQADQIEALAARIAADPNRRALRALVNNAGIGQLGPVEILSIDQWRRMFEVNLFGHIAVTQALLPALRRSQGRVINISSVNGKVTMAGYGAYAGVKFAVEGMSDALRQELKPQGVPVIIVEPGGVKTEMSVRGTADALTSEQNRLYGPLMRAPPAHVAAFTKAGVTADYAAQRIARIVSVRKPRARYTIGRDAAMITRLAWLLLDRLLDRALAANLRPHFTAAQPAR